MGRIASPRLVRLGRKLQDGKILPVSMVEMMGLEPMSKFVTFKIIYKLSLFIFEQFFK